MKLFFWRRKPQPQPEAPSLTAGQAAAVATTTAIIERSQIPTRPLAMPIELRDALLRFALDCLVAGGARVRVEASDLISAVLPDGTLVRYTISLTRARDEEDTELLVQGGAALAKLLDECAAHAAAASLHLEAHADPLALVRAQLAAAPADCGACARDESAELCRHCPLRTDRIVLAGISQRAAPRLTRQWMGRGIELTYAIVANDRSGRRDEEARLAFDGATGRRLPLLAPETLADAQAQTLPDGAADELNTALAHADRALAPQLRATGALLRLLAEREYRARLNDIRTTSRRLLRESPDEATAIHEALARELERLGEVYAVDVDARLAGVCFIERPMAAFTIPTRAGASVELLADLASGTLLPPVCAACGAETHTATACDNGHLSCPACLIHDARDADNTPNASAGCPVCAGASAASQHALLSSVREEREVEDIGTLTVAHLDAMSAATWRLFVIWLLEQDGYRIEREGASDALDYWVCQSADDGAALLGGALRFADCRALMREDVERLAAQQAGRLTGSSLLISTAPAGSAARGAAERLGVRLLDRAALAERLDRLVARQLHEREAATQRQESRAEEAAAARAALLDEVQRAEEVLASAGNTRRAAGRSAVAAAAKALTGAFASASRALLAWETLVHDWTAAFDEREARDGSLAIRADAPALAEMAERARHLGVALAEALGSVAGTPGVGDLGYTVWRRDTLEQLSAQCEAYRWRVLGVDPARWQDFAAAHDILAYERAADANARAAHAATRASRAYAELARHARIEESTA